MSFPSAGIPEANGHSPAHSSTSVTGKSGSGSSVSVTGVTGGGGAAAVAPAGGAVVDLTLDSSSEEEGGGAGGDSEDTEDSEDSPAPKRGRYNYDKDLVTAYWPHGSVPSKTETHTQREAGGWRYEDRNTVNPLDATTLHNAQMSEPLSSSGCYPDKANTLSHALLPNLQSRLI